MHGDALKIQYCRLEDPEPVKNCRIVSQSLFISFGIICRSSAINMGTFSLADVVNPKSIN